MSPTELKKAIGRELEVVGGEMARDFRAKYANALLQVEMRDAIGKITGLDPSSFHIVDYNDRGENTVTFKL